MGILRSMAKQIQNITESAEYITRIAGITADLAMQLWQTAW